MFFVVSGFLITSLSLRRWGSLDRVPIAPFYRLRAARILPCLLLLLAVLSVLHLAEVPGFTIPPERASLGRALLAGIGFHVNWLEGHRGYLPANWDVLWSLSIEETFYVLFPLVCLALRRERSMLWPLLALIVIGPFNRVALAGQQPWDDYHWLSGMDGIAFGCLAAWVCVRRPPGLTALRAVALLGELALAMQVHPTGRLVQEYEWYRSWATCLAVAPDGLTVATAGDDHVIAPSATCRNERPSAQGPQQPLGLVQRLLVLPVRVRVGHDPAADRELDPPTAGREARAAVRRCIQDPL